MTDFTERNRANAQHSSGPTSPAGKARSSQNALKNGLYTISAKLPTEDSAEDSEYSWPPAFESGAGGLVSTVDDYHAFCRMMLNKGAWGRERILEQASVEAMTSDQLMPQQRQGAELFFRGHGSWGFGMGVNILAAGRFGWDGGFGTSAYSDPANDLIGILMTQRLMDSPEPPPVFKDFWTHAYASN